MSSLDHVFLNGLLFLSFYLITKRRQDYVNNHFWRAAAIPILLYCIVLGCSFGMGADYQGYQYAIEHPFYDKGADEIGLVTLNKYIHLAGLNYVGGFIVYDLIFCIGVFSLIRSCPDNKYMMALMLPCTMFFITSPIRQALAHSFVYLGLMAINRQRLALSASMFYLGFLFHGSSLVTVTICIVCYFLLNRAFDAHKIVLAYCIVSIFSFTMMEMLSTIIDELVLYIPTFGLHYGDYLINSNRHFGVESIDKEHQRSFFAFVLTMIYYSGILYLSGLALKYKFDKKIAWLVWASIIGIFLYAIFPYSLIPKRLAQPMYSLSFITLGYGLYVYLHDRERFMKSEREWADYSFIGVMAYLVLFYGRHIFVNPEAKYFWNL